MFSAIEFFRNIDANGIINLYRVRLIYGDFADESDYFLRAQVETFRNNEFEF
jgi:hypothetical protein